MSLEICIENFGFNNKTMFNKQSLMLEYKKIYGVVGENGIGKSTLLNIITGELEADISIKYNGNKLTPGYNTVILFISDSFIGLEYLTPLEVVQYYSILYNKPINKKYLDEMLKLLNLSTDKVKNELIKNLSKGTKQKVVFLIYMMVDIDVIIFDEGLENIDCESLESILKYLKKWVCNKEKICLIATHSKDILLNVNDCIKLLKKDCEAENVYILQGNI